MKNISQPNFLKIAFSFPSLPEQQKIASFLSAVDRRIQLLTQKKEKLEQYKKGIMQQIFSQQLRFKDENGQEYSEWEEKRLGEICKIFGRIGFRGYTTSDIVNKGEGAISLSPSNINNEKIDFSNSTYISWSKYEESPEIMINIGDIILVKTASIGKVAYIDTLPEKSTINPQLVVLKRIKGHALFYSYLLSTDNFKQDLKRIAAGGVVPTISQEILKSLIVKSPIICEQQKIASFLSSIDQKITLVNQQIELTRKWKQGLLQKMFV